MNSKTFLICLFIGMVVVSTIAVPISKPTLVGKKSSEAKFVKIEVAGREGRQYGGFGSSNAFAQANANSNSFGGGFPGGFGGGFSASNAQASAGANGFGGYGRK